MADNNLTFTITADSKDAMAALKSLQKGFDAIAKTAGITGTGLNKLGKETKALAKSASSAESGFSKLQAQIVTVQAAYNLLSGAISRVSGAVRESINLYSRQEAAEKNLASALKLTGNYTDDLFSSMKTFAAELQQVSTVGDEATLEMLQLGTQMGLGSGQAKEFVKAAVELSAVTGKDTRQSFIQLTKTLAGTAGELGEMLPALRQMSPEALKTGAAVEMINQQFGGTAQAQLSTYAAASAQASNAFGDLQEEIGRTVVELLDLAGVSQKSKVIYEQAGAAVVQFRNAWQSVNWDELSAGIQAVSAGIAVGIVAQTPKLQAAAVSMGKLALASLKFVTVGAGLVVVGGSIELVARNINNLSGLWDSAVAVMSGAWNRFQELVLSGARFMLTSLMEFMDALPAGVQRFVGGSEGIARAIKNIGDAEIELIRQQPELAAAIDETLGAIDTGFTGKAVNAVKQFAQAFSSAGQTTTATADAVTESVGKVGGAATGLSQTAKDLDAIVESMRQSITALASEELSGVDRARLSVALEREKIAALERQMALENTLGAAEKARFAVIKAQLNTIEQISVARAPIASEADLAVMTEIQRAAEQINRKNAAAGMTQREIYNQGLQAQLDQLDAVRERLQLELKSTDNAARQLAIVQQLDALGSQEFTIRQEIAAPEAAANPLAGLGDLGSMLGETLMSVLGPQLMQVFTQFTNIIGLILQAPALINALTSFIDQIAEFPIKLMEAVVGFVKSIGTFIPRLIEGLMQAIPEIVMSLISLLYEVLPNLVNQGVEMGIKFTEGILKKLPEIITKFIVGFITAIPRVVVGFIRGIVVAIPAIVKGIIQAIPEIVRALVDGIMQAFSSIGDMFSGLLGEAGGGLGDIGSSISEGFESAGESIATSSSELFALLDSNAEARGLDISDRIAKAIDSATNRTASVWERIMAALRAVWDFIKRYVWDPMMATLEAAWVVIKAIWDGMMLVLEYAWDAIKIIWDAMMSVLSATWDFVKSTWDIMVGFLKGVWDEMMNLLSGVWDGVKSIWDGMMTILSALWDGVKLLWDTFIVKPLKAIWDFVKTLFDDPIAAFKGLWADIKSIFTSFLDGLSGIWEKLKSGFASITEGLGKIASSLWDFAKNIAAKFVEAAGKLWEKTKELFGKFGDIIGGAAGALWTKTKELFSGLGSVISGAAGDLWNALKSKVGGIGQVVVDSINGALSGVGNFLSRVFKFDGGGKGGVENFLGFDFPWFAFAEGGVVPGVPKRRGDHADNDTVPALLSPGEIVIPRSMTQDKAFMAVVDAKFRGRDVPQYSLGGAIQAIGRGDFQGAKKEAEKTGVGQVIVQTGDAITENVIDPLVDAFSKIGKQAEGVYNFLQNLGASMPSIEDLISDPVKALKKAFEGVAKGFFLPEARKGIQRNAGSGSPAGSYPIPAAIREQQKAITAKMPSLKRLGFAEGGLVPGYAFGGEVGADTVPAMLTPGEFVMRRSAVNSIGAGALQAMNNGTLGQASTAAPIINVSMTVNSTERVDVKRLMTEMKSELRRESLRGSFIIAQNGLRG